MIYQPNWLGFVRLVSVGGKGMLIFVRDSIPILSFRKDTGIRTSRRKGATDK